MKRFRLFSHDWPGVAQWFVGAGKLLLVFAAGLIIIAFVWPLLLWVALCFLAAIVVLVGSVLLYGMLKLRKIRRQMREFSKTFSERSGSPSDPQPQRPRQRVQCKVRETPPDNDK